MDLDEQHCASVPANTSLSDVACAGTEWRVRAVAGGAVLAAFLVKESPMSQEFRVPGDPAPKVNEWEWEDGRSGSGLWKSFSAEAAAAIAAAEVAQVSTFDLKIGGHSYAIDLHGGTQTRKSTGFVRRLRLALVNRPPPVHVPTAASLCAPGPAPCVLRTFPGGYEAPPPYWSELSALDGGSGSGAHYQLCDVSMASAVAQEVLCMLGESSSLESLRLRNVYAVRDPDRFDMYAVQKKAMAKKGDANERWLWHGTEGQRVPAILSNGFLRDYNSKAAYGKGVYFAKSASYSLSPSYAVPDVEGDVHLILARVLVGAPCMGKPGMERPHPKPGSDELCDSMVDRLDEPKVVVLSAGSDHRAYPEFVLRLRTPSV